MVVELLDRKKTMDLYQRTSRRLAALLLRLDVDPSTPIPHLSWNVGELAAHLVQAAQVAGELLSGKPSPYTELRGISATNATLLEQDAERRLDVLSNEFVVAIDRVDQLFQKMPDDMRVPWHAGITMSPPQAMAMISCEFLMHGWDLSRAIKSEWPIDESDALMILYASTELMPNFVDKNAANGFTARYEVRLRGGKTLLLAFDNGELVISIVEPGTAADCRISAAPVPFLLMGFGRGSQLVPLLTGKIIAWGRKPWLAPKFTTLVRTP